MNRTLILDTYEILIRKSEGKIPRGRLGVRLSIILKWVLKNRMWPLDVTCLKNYHIF